MKRCPSCLEFIANSAHTCPKCGANDPFRIVEKESIADEIAVQKASQMTSRKGSGTLRPPVPLKTNVIIVLIGIFYLFIAVPLFLSEIHSFFKGVIFLISMPLVFYASFKADN